MRPGIKLFRIRSQRGSNPRGIPPSLPRSLGEGRGEEGTAILSNCASRTSSCGRDALPRAPTNSQGKAIKFGNAQQRVPTTIGDLRLPSARPRQRGSVLIIVLWIAFGLVSIALYFANSMTFELRASDNRLAALQAEHAIAGAVTYVRYLLANPEEPGTMPDVQGYQREAVAVGEATFWFIGRGDREGSAEDPFFSLVDEAAKLNLNTATREMLEALPRMTPELAAAIIDWRDSDSEVTSGGAETDTYLRRHPPYQCKNDRFESIDELRMVFGADLEILFGEDLNRNGILDPNENDGNMSPPDDNRDGRLEPGILEYVTVYSRESNLRSDGSPKVNLRQGPGPLAGLLQEKLSETRANQILQQLGPAIATIGSLLELQIRGRMTAEEAGQIAADITFSNGPVAEGLVNVNTASPEVLACIPGIGTENAASLVAYRQSNPDKLGSVAWVAGVLDQNSSIQAGRFLTANTYQLTADVAAVGRYGRGYQRARFVFDLTEGEGKLLYRQDLSHLGWGLGKKARATSLLAKESR